MRCDAKGVQRLDCDSISPPTAAQLPAEHQCARRLLCHKTQPTLHGCRCISLHGSTGHDCNVARHASATRARAEKDGNKHLLLNMERAKYWLALGAKPSESVARIFGQVGVLPDLPLRPKLPRATKNPDKWRGDGAKA